MSERDDQYESYSRERFAKQLEAVAAKLRDLADEVARVQTYRSGIARPPVLVVGDVVHAIQWGFANLPLDALASSASDIHEIERQRS
jgi:hypothetical protein